MKSIRLIAAAMFFAVLFAVPSFAQTGATAPNGAKFAVVDTGAFADEKAGITKFIAAAKSLNTQFAPRQKEIQDLTLQYNTLAKDIQTLSAAPPNTVNAGSVSAKAEQADKLKRDITYKQQEAQAAAQAASEKTLGPIYADIGRAMQDYAKQKGYSLILDLAKDQTGMVIYADMAQADVTADFIGFYNKRPAGTATTAAPKE